MKPARLLSICCALGLGGAAPAQDPVRPVGIGPVARFARSELGLTLDCADHSVVRIDVLAPDLVRVRASFQKPLAAPDHSWAVAKTSWDRPAWGLKEEAGVLRIATDELEVVVNRAPLLIEFRDGRTHRLINADLRPMEFDPGTGMVTAAKVLGIDEHFFGLGEKAARLDKRRGAFDMWTANTPGYAEGTDPLYQDIPFYLGWQGGEAYGIFLDNSYRAHFDFGSSNQDCATFGADGGEMNYYFFRGPAIGKVLGRYADLTGHMPMPPLWSLGSQQSRYSYYSAATAEEIVRRYRADDLPLDVLHLDLHYMNGYRVFTWDPGRFPDPRGFVERLKKAGVKVVVIVDPGVKYQPPATGAIVPAAHPELASQEGRYYVFDQGLAGGFFLRRTNGDLHIGRVWPGDSVFVDYTIDAAARWWGDLHRAYTDQGVAGIWNDMNEPADFLERTGRAQTDTVFNDGGTNSPFAKNRNVFGLNMARATYEGLERLLPGRRPFVITRAGYAGIQRYSTMWTGDIPCTWESLALTLPMFETLGLSGEPFVGADIGGFRGRADGELLARWYEAAFLSPLCRNHAENRSYDHEPWRFGTDCEGIIRKYLKLRYRLLPFLYTTLEEAHRTGVPLFRPLLLNYQDDANTLTIDDEYMVGADLLAAPILKSGQTARLAYLPRGIWYDFWNGSRHPGGAVIPVEAALDATPLFVRGGSILPTGPEMNFVGEKPRNPVRFDIYPDERGRASTVLYEDDGETTDYRKGACRRMEVTYAQSGAAASIRLGKPAGDYRTQPRAAEFVIHAGLAPHTVSLDGQPLPSTAAASESNGWSRDGERLTLRIRDDGAPHEIAID